MMELLMLLGLLSFGIFCLYFFLLKWNQIRYWRKGLPPGTMGWHFFGETLQFLGDQGPNFMKKQRARYGNVFKSHILGCPTIISMDPELNKYILLNEAKGLIPGYPQSMVDILGKYNIGAVSGFAHKLTRGATMFQIGPSAVKEQLFSKVDKALKIFLQNWEGKIIDIQEKTQDMVFVLQFKQIMEDESSSSDYECFKTEFDKLVAGTISLPINFPGTDYYKAFQARENVIKFLRKFIEHRRRASSSTIDHHHNDILNCLLDENSSYKFNDEEIIDQIIMILNSGYETVSTTSMMALKYLHDHPKALEELRDEHFMIRQGKSFDEPIEWLDYKRMIFTRAVIFETQRLATVVNGVMRKVTKDIELNGFVIPKGWKIYVYTREINYDPYIYPEPFKFNPWRWLQDKSLESHSHLFLFGKGSRLCPGKELGILTISLFLHYLVTKYRWEEVGENIINQFPRVQAPKGLHIRFTKHQ